MANADQPGEDYDRQMGTRILDLEKALGYHTEHVVNLEKQITKCIQNERNTASALTRLESNYVSLHNYTKSLEDYCLELDLGTQKKHLLLTGIPETEAESREKISPISGENTGSGADNSESRNENGEVGEEPQNRIPMN